MRLPAKRKRKRSGIERGPQRVWPRHRRFVRSHACCVPDCGDGPIECAHVRIGGGGGTGLKPHDAHTISLCKDHHLSAHTIGEVSFAKKHAIDLQRLAREFVARSPDTAMKDAMREAGLM